LCTKQTNVRSPPALSNSLKHDFLKQTLTFCVLAKRRRYLSERKQTEKPWSSKLPMISGLEMMLGAYLPTALWAQAR
jgi:hypothetical protein